MIAFDVSRHIDRVVIVGVGGTGAQVASKIARVLFDMDARDMSAPKMVLIDMDAVEHKNVGRQLFTPYDAQQGVNKAVSMARRLSMAYGLQIEAVTTTISAYAEDRYAHSNRSTLLIDCVDNHLARAAIVEMEPGLVVSCGNDRVNGQVIVGNVYGEVQHQRKPRHGGVSQLPAFNLVMPELVEPPPQVDTNELSCAELTVLGEQHLLINDLMADVAASYAYKVLHRQALNTHMTYVSVDPLAVRSLPISAELLEQYGILHEPETPS